MPQVEMPFEGKMDEPLAKLCATQLFDRRARMPILIKYDGNEVQALVERILQLGGKVRHTIERFHLVSAWMPLESVPVLAQNDHVRQLELEQSFSVMT
jgi:hypothetical protein